MAGFWTGLNQYHREVEEQKRYREAFALKEEQFALSKASFALSKEKLEFQKEQADFENQYNILKTLESAGMFTGASGGIGRVGKKGGKGQASDATYMKAIIKDFGVSKESLTKFSAATGNQSDVFQRIYTELARARKDAEEKGYQGGVTNQEIGDFFERITKTSVSGDTIWSNLEEMFPEGLSPRIQELKGNYAGRIFSEFVIPSMPVKREKAGLEGAEDIANSIYNSLDLKYNNELASVKRELDELLKKEKVSPLTSPEVELKKYLDNRFIKLNQVKGYSKTNQLPLFKLYGTQNLYKSFTSSPDLAKTYPETSILPRLNIPKVYPTVPFTVQNESVLRDLVSKGIIEEGSEVNLVEGVTINGQVVNKIKARR
tara:strand:+ start:257 stop:1378 length:1122 start_codon:yes stop_codon:yes gene_type:complete